MNMNARSKSSFIDHEASVNNSSFFEKHASMNPANLDYAASQLEPHTQANQKEDFFPERRGNADIPHFLVTMYKGIGDAV
jgi:hypothetical protein